MSRKCLLSNSITDTNQQTNAADDIDTHTRFLCIVAAPSRNQNSFFSSSICIYIYTCVLAFDKVELFLCIAEQYSEKNSLLSFAQHTRELGEESVESNDNAQCASVYIYIYRRTRRLLLFASLAIGICTHSFITRFSFSYSFFFFPSCLLDVQLVDR